MQALLDTIRANPWPFIGMGIAVVTMILAEFFGSRKTGADFPDLDWD